VRGGVKGGRGKQTKDPVFADEIAGPIEGLHADIVEIDAPVHASMNVGLGDDEKMRLLQKRHDLRCDLQKFITAFEHAQLARAHNAEGVIKVRFKRLAVDKVVAHAEESEVVSEEPLEELN